MSARTEGQWQQQSGCNSRAVDMRMRARAILITARAIAPSDIDIASEQCSVSRAHLR